MCIYVYVHIPGEPWALIIGRRDAFLVGLGLRVRRGRLWECLNLGLEAGIEVDPTSWKSFS